MAGIDTAAMAAKFFRDYFENDNNQMPTQKLTDMIDELMLSIIQKNGEEIKKEEIIDMFFKNVGVKYDNDANRSEITSSLKRLVDRNLIDHTNHGYYRAK